MRAVIVTKTKDQSGELKREKAPEIYTESPTSLGKIPQKKQRKQSLDGAGNS